MALELVEGVQLSYIVILHQTTTHGYSSQTSPPLSYIVILHQTTTNRRYLRNSHCCLISLFYIKPQLVVAHVMKVAGCLISLFYIKPQLFESIHHELNSCLISLFYIKPQLADKTDVRPDSCLISLFYIKPQLLSNIVTCTPVVLYRYSTSNHNNVLIIYSLLQLSYIVILHQTTTAV